MKNAMIFLVIAVMIGCAPQERKYFDQLNLGGEGVFRGIHIRDSQKKIKALEQEKYLVINEDVYLKYIYPFDEQIAEKGRYEVEYYFDGQDQLHEVIINAFVTDKEEASRLYEDLKVKFTGEYGDFRKNEDGYIIWQGKTLNTNQLEIALINDSKYNEATGYLTLQINDFDY